MSEQPIFKITEKMFQQLTEWQEQIDATNGDKIETNQNISAPAEDSTIDSTITAAEKDKLPSEPG